MFSPVILRDDLTRASYDYISSELPMGSHKFVIVECSNCNTLIRRELRNIGSKHSCPRIIGDKKHCYSCKEWKDLSQFNKNSKLQGGVSKLCRSCYNNHEAVKKYEQQRCMRLKNAINEGDFRFYIQRRGQRMLSSWKSANIPFDLTTHDLIILWEAQQGLCHYTNIPMIGSGTDKGLPVWNSPSLDRLTPSIGYMRGNVVWCLNSINSFKGQLNELEFKAVVQQISWRW